MPANGETVTVTTDPSVPVDISLNLLKREMALGGLCFISKEALVIHPSLGCVKCGQNKGNGGDDS